MQYRAIDNVAKRVLKQFIIFLNSEHFITTLLKKLLTWKALQRITIFLFQREKKPSKGILVYAKSNLIHASSFGKVTYT